jgi:GH25 family lysozyme M1 (1,4-beta-N-acetylmuramidase)
MAGCRSADCTSWIHGMSISSRCSAAMIRAKMRRRAGCCGRKYGKGIYIYTGYAFFRQLPAGVPGAVRLYVNLLSAGQ